MKEHTFNIGDFILAVIFLSIVSFLAVNEWNIINHLEQFSSAQCAGFYGVLGGEVLSFALYKIGKQKYMKGEAVSMLQNEEKTDPMPAQVENQKVETDMKG